eukprot:4787042-Pleurochrysis_carterae.AAC.2
MCAPRCARVRVDERARAHTHTRTHARAHTHTHARASAHTPAFRASRTHERDDAWASQDVAKLCACVGKRTRWLAQLSRTSAQRAPRALHPAASPSIFPLSILMRCASPALPSAPCPAPSLSPSCSEEFTRPERPL